MSSIESRYNRGGRSRGRGQRGRGRGRGGGGRPPTSNTEKRTTHKVSFYKVKEMSRDSIKPQDALFFCTNSSFQLLMEEKDERVMSTDMIDYMLMVIKKAFQSGTESRGIKRDLAQCLLQGSSSYFLTKHCMTRFRNDLTAASNIRVDYLIDALTNYLDVYNHLCNTHLTAMNTLMGCLREVDGMIMYKCRRSPELQGVSAQYQDATEISELKERDMEELKKKEKRQKRTGREQVDVRPDGDFRDISVCPTKRDLRIIPKIRKNKEQGDFKDADDYLDVQFRLLREDFISTIRNGIRDYKKSQTLTGPQKFKSGDVKIYDNLYIAGSSFGRDGLTYIVRINNNSYLSKTKWSTSKRLMYGSLLCLSQDGFNATVLFAVIAGHDREKILAEGLEIKFLDESMREFNALDDPYKPFTAVESTAYFEAYTHILKGMQNIDAQSFPLEKYIVRCEMDVRYPAYLKSRVSTFQLIGKDHDVSDTVNLTSYESQWPEASELGLNDSQYSAFKSALTQEMSIIQGPPGTGKTYVGLKIMEALLFNLYGVADKKTIIDNKSDDESLTSESDDNDSDGESQYSRPILARAKMCPPAGLHVPILIVCYTNHALDQFLEGILQFCPKQAVVRVGSRSQNEALQSCNLRNRSRDTERSAQLRGQFYEMWNAKSEFEEKHSIQTIKGDMAMSQTSLLSYAHPNFIPETETVLYYNLYGLAELHSQYISGMNDSLYAMYAWLECAINPSVVINTVNPVPEDTDTEEDRREDNSNKPELIDVVGDADRELELRVLDTDDANDDWRQRMNQTVAQANSYQDAADFQQPTEDDDGFIMKITRKTREKMTKKVERSLSSSDRMSKSEVESYCARVTDTGYDITIDMPLEDRWRLYRYWLWNYQQMLNSKLHDAQQEYIELCEKEKTLRMCEDKNVLEKAKVIGMTTTGAAKIQDVLLSIKPRIVVVEEAAEVLEAHITTALGDSCEQLILIGDHKQLKPNPTVYELAKEYKLDLSMFERMINNGFPVVTLDTQHRMRPEISVYMKYIYDKLCDHESVINREPIRGISRSVYFFDHKNPEQSDNLIMSHANEFEAEMITAFSRYLIAQNYHPSEITIITMYTGQLLMLKKLMPKSEFGGIKITSVDNFQGEENTIVIVSLVRNNEEDSLGFVKVENRICVALSRARHGMYVFGNFDMMSRGSELWNKIITEAKDANIVGDAFDLSCGNHGNKAKISKPEDFNRKSPAGGCVLDCSEVLNCGHQCSLPCHYTDRDHKQYKCMEDCTKELPGCEHPCPDRCHETCAPCRVPKMVTLMCGHIRTVHCSKPDHEVECVQPCPDPLDCGHPCEERCSMACTKRCKVPIDRMCSRCGEMSKVFCFELGNPHLCNAPCAETMQCGHKCQKSCSECSLTSAYETDCSIVLERKVTNIHDQQHCMATCNQKLSCGHRCQQKCSECSMRGHMLCVQQCWKLLECGHRCNRKCHECAYKCGPCGQECLLTCCHGFKCGKRCDEECFFHDDGQSCYRGCKHVKCTRLCTEACSHVPCHRPCEKKLSCHRKKCKKEYKCVGMCGDTCPFICPDCDLQHALAVVKRIPDLKITEGMRWVYLRDCKHRIPVAYMDVYVNAKGDELPITCPLPFCGKAVLNTSRYVPKTRLIKTRMDEQLAAFRRRIQEGRKAIKDETERLRKHRADLTLRHTKE